MQILVTGGAGFIGSVVIRHIISDTQHFAVNVDKLTYAGNLDSLASVASSKRYAFEKVDICDGAAVNAVFAKHQPDAVMHLAAESHVDRSIDGPGEFIQTNIVGTYTLLEAARAYRSQLSERTRISFAFITYLLTKFMVTWRDQKTFLERTPHMRQALPTRHLEQGPITL